MHGVLARTIQLGPRANFVCSLSRRTVSITEWRRQLRCVPRRKESAADWPVELRRVRPGLRQPAAGAGHVRALQTRKLRQRHVRPQKHTRAARAICLRAVSRSTGSLIAMRVCCFTCVFLSVQRPHGLSSLRARQRHASVGTVQLRPVQPRIFRRRDGPDLLPRVHSRQIRVHQRFDVVPRVRAQHLSEQRSGSGVHRVRTGNR